MTYGETIMGTCGRACVTPLSSGAFAEWAYGTQAWATILEKLGLQHNWTDSWLVTCPNPSGLMSDLLQATCEAVEVGRAGRVGE